jgi:hypothetical protein
VFAHAFSTVIKDTVENCHLIPPRSCRIKIKSKIFGENQGAARHNHLQKANSRRIFEKLQVFLTIE